MIFMNVLFICRGNVGRSQMAEAFFNRMSEKNHAFSAGTRALKHEGRRLSEFAGNVVKCMAALGYDLSDKHPKQLTREMAERADMVVSMTDKKDLPGYARNSPKLVLWDVEDAKGRSYEFHCRIRDRVKGLVEKLVEDIG